jgi:hypothetical protein
VKTIISIIEVILYNLFPATLAAPVVIVLKDVIPLLGVALMRLGLYIAIGLQKLQQEFRTHNAEGENLQLYIKFQKQE